MNKFAKFLISTILLIGLVNSQMLPNTDKVADLVQDILKDVNKSDIIEAGKKLGKILENFQKIKSEKTKPEIFLGLAAEQKEEDPCLQILENLENDAKTMLKNIFSDIQKVKEALDDFMANIKNIKNVCF